MVGAAIGVSAAGAGVSATTSAAGLSSRSPLKEACRTWPASVQPANWTSATSSGRTQWMLAAGRGVPGPVNGLLLDATAFSLGSKRDATSRPNPVPTRPTWMKWSPRLTPTIRERNCPPVSVQAPMTNSWPPRHLALVQVSLRPDRYGASACLETIPSSDMPAGRKKDGFAARVEVLDVAQ